MSRRIVSIIVILVLLGLAIWADLPNNLLGAKTVLGLDLRGGMQVILQVPEGTDVTAEQLDTAKQILENRTNGLGVSENSFQVAGTRIIVAEFPGKTNTTEVINSIKQTGLLEFVDLGSTQLQDGTKIQTTGGGTNPADGQLNAEGLPWTTIMTGIHLKQVGVTADQTNQPAVSFELDTEGAEIFKNYTTNNVGSYLAIVMDKTVISAPVIKSAITEGSGVIEGGYTIDSANAMAVNLRYGSLPVPLEVEQIRIVEPTLGKDSLDKSLIAGLIGALIVVLFMSIYYRVPGIAAVISLTFYAVVTFALYRLIPVTLTLPGIAGFLLSTGSALDANILIFERLKEELRNGRTMNQAVYLAWKRAWSSIRDSNIAALITSAILFWFGSTMGASIVKGFAFTLALGVLVSVPTAFFVTRLVLNLILGFVKDPEKRPNLFGI